MNNVSLTGRLTRDPELRDTRAGAVCRLRLAVDNPGRGGQKGEPTYIDFLGSKGDADERAPVAAEELALPV